MPSKVRVYEIARELGLSNAEIIDLCNDLGIGVKSHSSSIVEAQADRIRRKAEREGLKREPGSGQDDGESASEASAPDAETSANAPAARREAPASRAEKSAETPARSSDGAAPAPVSSRPPQRVVSSSGSAAPGIVSSKPLPPPPPRVGAAPRPPIRPAAQAPVAPPQPTAAATPAVAPVAPPAAEPVAASTSRTTAQTEPVAEPVIAPTETAPTEPVAEPVTVSTETVSTETVSTETVPTETVPTETVPTDAASAQTEPAAAESAATAPPAAEPVAAASVAAPNADVGVRPPAPPRTAAGKPIPPPPGPPRGRGGKPIPPPPGQARRAPTTGGDSRPGSGGPGGFRRPSPGGGAPSSPGTGAPGRGAPAGGRPGSGGRPGGGRNDRPRRKSRRRRNAEELQPMDVPTYSATDAPVPEGVVVIERASSAQDLGPKLARTAADVVRFLLTNGEMVTATQSLSDEMIQLFAEEIGAEIRLVDPGEEQEVELRRVLDLDEDVDDDVMDSWPMRPPVITIMGHVDHGKTLLLDRIRSANVVAGEAGGITQHIGAYQVEKNDHMLTFIDTPGHAAFTAMRARGAEATDIVVLVVAADDGVMPQTLEALDHARAAEVPILVAVNKMDREGADPDRVMSQLAERGLIPEAWGGDTMFVKVSAMTGDGIDELLDSLTVIAEIEDLRASPEGRAAGVVLESNLDIGRGPVATVLVERGTLQVGDPLVTGAAWGRVRAIINDRGENVMEAGPSTPVQVLGLSDVASSGDSFVVAPSEKIASKVADTREHWQRVASLGRDASATSGGAKLEDIFKQIQAGEAATLNLIVKADVNGSLEAVTDSLRKLERDDVKLAFVLRGVGGISENDVQLAATSNSTILGFNVRPDRKARELAEAEKVEIRNYEIIYKLLEDIENAMLGLLAPEFEEVVTGEAQVREVFRVPRIGAVAGCMVLNGTISRNSKVRFLREGTIIWKGEIQSLRRFKDDVASVAAGFECGIGLSDFQDLKEGDIIETFEERLIPVK